MNTGAAPALTVRGTSDLHGQVVDERGLPVAGVRVALVPTRGGIHRALEIVEDRAEPTPQTASAGGEFRFAQLANGPWQLFAQAPDGRVQEVAFAAPWRGDIGGMVVQLPDHSWRSPRVAVRVLTPAGDPVAGAAVGVHGIRGDAAIVPHDGAPTAKLVTDAAGRGVFAELPRGPLLLTASTDDGRVGVLLEVPRCSEAERHATVLVEPCGGIDAELVGGTDGGLAGSRLRALLVPGADSSGWIGHGLQWTVAVQGGRAELRNLPVGRYALVLESPHGGCLDLPRNANTNLGNTAVPWTVDVASGQVASTRMRVVPGGLLAGRVVDEAGAPIAGARVAATFTSCERLRAQHAFQLGVPVWRLDSLTLGLPHPSHCVEATTDAAGDYVFAGLSPGLHQIEITARDHTFVRHHDVAIEAGHTTRRDARLGAAGVLQGVVDAEPYVHLAAIAAGSAQPTVLAVLPPHASFTLPGLAPGEWQLAGWRHDEAALTPLATVHVAAGRMTWIDLRSAPTARIAGRVVDARGRAVAGLVTVRTQQQMLQSDGSFAFELAAPLGNGAWAAQLEVSTASGCWQLPFPSDSYGACAWRGDFVLGEGSLEVALHDSAGRTMAGRLWLSGPQLVARELVVPKEGATLRDLFAGRYRLHATAPAALFEPQELELPAATRVTLAGAPGAQVDVRVLDARGRIRPGMHVLLRSARSTHPVLTRSDADGIARALVLPGPVQATFESWVGRDLPSVSGDAALGVPLRLTLQLPER